MSDNGLGFTMARKEVISKAEPERYTTLRSAAQTLSLRNVDQSVCELFAEALAHLVQTLYEGSADDPYNVDFVTGKILIPLPWGRNGHKRWAVYPGEAVTLREIMTRWSQEEKPLVRFDKSRRAWFVALKDYPDIQAANKWLLRHPVTIDLYRAARKENPRTRSDDHRQRARAFGAEGTHTDDDIRGAYVAQRGKCRYCGLGLSDDYETDHVVPLSRGGKNDAANLVVCCPDCNKKKGTRLLSELPSGWALSVGRQGRASA